MRALTWLFVLMSSVAFAEGEFPLPSVDGKPAVQTEDRKAWNVPLGFKAVERFYRAHFKGTDVKVQATDDKAGRVLKLTTKDPKAKWVRAVVREGAVHTRIEITEVVRGEALQLEGNATPSV